MRLYGTGSALWVPKAEFLVVLSVIHHMELVIHRRARPVSVVIHRKENVSGSGRRAR